MSALKQVCECGHDRSSHFEDLHTRKRWACLCRCACREHVPAADPSAPKGVPDTKATLTSYEPEDDEDPGWLHDLLHGSGGSD